MKPVLIVNPSDQASTYQGLSANWTAMEPPVWCRLLTSYLDKKGIPVDIFDMAIFGNKVDHLLKDYSLFVVSVMGHQPSASTQTMPAAIKLCELLRPFNVPIVVMGTHPAALPAQTLRETGADFVCTGEGFNSVAQLYATLELADIEDVLFGRYRPAGICMLNEDGEVLSSPPAPNVWDMDEIPGGTWEKLPELKNYRCHNWHGFGFDSRSPYASIYTSLGCPYSCSFCCIQSPFREGDKLRGGSNSYRMWSADHVADELEELAALGVKHVKISDEMFLLNRRHVNGICDELKRRGLIAFNFWFYSRVDTVKDDDALLDKMKSVGMNWACLGIESANDQTLSAVDKRDYDNEEVFKAVRQLQKHGINVIGNYIVGLPEDTLDSMGETRSLAQYLNTEFMNVYPAVAYPGSKLFEDKVTAGWEPPPWSAYSFHSYDHQPLGNENLTPAEVLRFRDEMFQRYMTSNNYLWMVREKFGERTAEEIKEMVNVKLKRKLLGD